MDSDWPALMIWSTRRYTAEDTTVYSSACEDSDEGRFRSASVLWEILVMTVLGTGWRSLLLLDMGWELTTGCFSNG